MAETNPSHVTPSEADGSRDRGNQRPEPPRVPPILPLHQVHPQAPPAAPIHNHGIAINCSGSGTSSAESSLAAAPAGAFASLKKKKEDKFRKRDPRSLENIQKAIMNMSVEASFKYLEDFYNQLYTENRHLLINLQTKEKQCAQYFKEQEKDRSDLSKAILAKGQLESLCRELQKQNKIIKDENVARIKEEEEKRREVANSFTERLNSLTNLISESKDKSNQIKEENQSIGQKFAQLYDQYQERESHLDAMTKRLDLQKKLTETQIKKAAIEHEAERQTLMAEKNSLAITVDGMEKEIMALKERNNALAAQVDLYKNQYSAFETTMTKSNHMFETFKTEMGQMNKKLRQLELEREQLKTKYQTSVSNLVSLSEKHLTVENEKSKLEIQLMSVKKLCRKLQEDRNALIRQLKSCNLEPDLKPFSQDAEAKPEPEDFEILPDCINTLQLASQGDEIATTEENACNGEDINAVEKDAAAKSTTAAEQQN